MSDIAEYLDEALRPDDAPSDDVVRGYMAALRSPDDSEERAEAEARPPWQIEDEGAADWAARKVQQARRAIAEKKVQRDLIVEQADAWLAAETEQLDRRARFFEGCLIDWLRRELEADPKGKKSRDLPCGVKVARRSGQATVDVFDEAAFIAWAKDTHHHMLLRVKESVDKKAVKDAAYDVLMVDDDQGIDWSRDESGALVTPDGEKVPGLAATTTPDSYRVDVGGGR